MIIMPNNWNLKRAYIFLTNDGIIQRHLAKKKRALDSSLSSQYEKMRNTTEIFMQKCQMMGIHFEISNKILYEK